MPDNHMPTPNVTPRSFNYPRGRSNERDRGYREAPDSPGKLEDFKALQTQCMAITRSKDTGTLQYDVFFNEDGSECIVHERYRDSDALLEHLANLGETATALFQICSAEGEVLGTPSAKLRKALEGGPVRIVTPYQSLRL